MEPSWEPISEAAIWDALNDAELRMTPRQRYFWEFVRITPEKWAQHPWGDEGGGFWVVAILGNTVLWYNDIEEGFNLSRWKSFGHINEYHCNQDRLEVSLQRLIGSLDSGLPLSGHVGPPVA